MRTDIITYIQGLNLGSYTVSTEVPWLENGVPLYRKNLKKVYVDVDQIEMEPVVTALNGLMVQGEVTIVRVYFASDAKVLPPNYEDVVSQIKQVRDVLPLSGYYRRQVDVSTSFENDVIVTELEFRFTKILT